MPKPPVLPVLDWSAVFASGQTFDEWIAGEESAENKELMERLLAGQRLGPHVAAMLAALPRPVNVVAIAEAWCGDVVRHVPVLERLAQAAPKIEVRYVAREQHPDVFARFLTNGGEAIPKFVFLSGQFVECGHWGPMPAACRRLIARGKACDDVAAARNKVAALYQADADCSQVVAELLELVGIVNCGAP